MAVFNGNKIFSSKKTKSLACVKYPRSVKQALNVDRIYRSGICKIERKDKQAIYDRCYIFEDINYINKNAKEQGDFLLELMLWLNSMNVQFKITFANEYQNMEEFLKSLRKEKNRKEYPSIARGIRQWQETNLDNVNPSINTVRYLTVTCVADNYDTAKIYLNSLENTITDAFEGWGSRIYRLSGIQRIKVLYELSQPGGNDQDYISDPDEKRDWKNDVLPKSIRQHKNFMVFNDNQHVSVLFGWKYRRSIDSDSFIRNLTNLTYPSFCTLDFAPVENEVVNDKLAAAMVNNDREITDELNIKRNAGILAVTASYSKEKRKNEIEDYIDQVDKNDEKGFFVNLLIVVTAEDEDTLAKRVNELQAIGRKEGVVLDTADYRQLKAWNTALPIGGRQVDYMRFFLTSSIVAFQPYHAQDVIESDGQMYGINKTTHRFIIGDRKKLPNPHGIIIGFSGTGKSMFIKLTELSQTLLATDDDIIIIDPQNEFEDICNEYHGAYVDMTPKSGMYLNGFEVTEEVFQANPDAKREFVAAQAEYAKTICAAAMKNIMVTQEHDSVISRCTERMFDKIFSQKKLKIQPTLVLLRDEVLRELTDTNNTHDEDIIRSIYNCLHEYTDGSCDMLSKPSTININSRLVGFGMANVPENNWEAVMVTVLHYLSTRMNFNKKMQRATHLIVDEAQVVSKKPGSADQLNNAVITFRKFGGIVTMAMQNVTAALSNPTLVELFQNCSYKCFLDQGGVDAQSLAAIQELSAKEYRALGSGKVGEGIIVWNKKVLMFNARIAKDNILYDKFNTNFHEKVRTNSRSEGQLKKIERMSPKNVKNQSSKWYDAILMLSEMTPVSIGDVAAVLDMSQEESKRILDEMAKGHLLEVLPEGKYRKVIA